MVPLQSDSVVDEGSQSSTNKDQFQQKFQEEQKIDHNIDERSNRQNTFRPSTCRPGRKSVKIVFDLMESDCSSEVSDLEGEMEQRVNPLHLIP